MSARRTGLQRAVVVIGAGLLASLLGRLVPLDRVDGLLFDATLRLEPVTLTSGTTIVAIDDESLALHGRWPWDRGLQARLLERIAAARPRAIGLLILYAEPGDAPALDRRLQRVLCGAVPIVQPVVLGPLRAEGTRTIALPGADFAGCAAALGHASVLADGDGVARRLALRAAGPGHDWPSFAEAVLRVARRTGDDHAVREHLPPRPLGAGASLTGPVLLRMNAGEAPLPVHSAASMLAALVPPADLAGRIVLVGVTAAGAGTEITTAIPTGRSRVSAVEFQALALAALDARRLLLPLRSPAEAALSVLAAMLAVGAALAVGGGLRSLPVGLVVGAGAVVLARLAGWWLPPTPVLAAILAVQLVWAARVRIQSLAQIRRDRQRARAALDAITDAVVTTDRDGRIDYLNPSAERLLGQPRERVCGSALDATVRLVDLDEGRPVRFAAAPPPAEIGPAAPPTPGRFELRTGTSGALTVRATAASMHGRRGRIEGLVVALSDVSAEQRLLDEISYRATHDALTGLPNRRLAKDRLEHAIEVARRIGRAVGVVFLDLDRFKAINDALGHTIGDLMLREAARRLAQSARRADTVARIGGDEFLVLLQDLDETGAMVAVRRYAEALEGVVEAQGHRVRLSASFGVALFPRDGATGDELMRHADLAMDQAKEDGRDAIRFFSPEMNARAADRLVLDHELRVALERRQIELHFQPQIRLADASVCGLECLARWRHPERGVLPPSSFIPFAEETGLICALGRIVLEDGLRQLAAWTARRPGLRLAVNLSVVQLKRDPELVEFVADLLREHRLSAAQLELEITEGVFLDPALPVIDERLRALAARGIRLSIDDFGTGYSSLAYLNRFPFSRIKIDRSFVCGIDTDGDARAIVRTIVELGHSLRKSIVAEGVETDAQLAFLREIACDEAQGYRFGRPGPAGTVPL